MKKNWVSKVDSKKDKNLKESNLLQLNSNKAKIYWLELQVRFEAVCFFNC